MTQRFRRLEKFARAFYLGWKWSTEHATSRADQESFRKEVLEPFDAEWARLQAQGISIQELDKVVRRVRTRVWPDLEERRQAIRHSKNRAETTHEEYPS